MYKDFKRLGLCLGASLWAGLVISGCGGSRDLPGNQVVQPAANELRELPVYASQNGVLDVLMIAHTQTAPELTPFKPTAWVYTVCRRPVDGSNVCPPSSGTPNDYGGTRLQAWPGDTIKVHLVNQLPPANNAKHAAETGESFLTLNPTNLHTHGMLISPRYADASDPSWGDNVFVYALNSANGKPDATAQAHGTIQYGVVDYTYKIPADHPSGLFWFHPHVHGISLNQISAGMSGLITIGDVSDYLCVDDACQADLSKVPTRHMLLKDTQILADGSLQHQIDPDFCQGLSREAAMIPARNGGCDGADFSASEGENYVGGRWFFTINGQNFPTVTVGSPAGQIWRITNSAASATYDLNLWETTEKREMLMKVIAIDGVSVDTSTSASTSQLVDMAGNKFQAVPCPTIAPTDNPGICTTRLHLMPSSRAEVWVTYRDAQGLPHLPPAGANAIFRTAGYQTGPTGDNWPAVNLASVNFVPGTVLSSDLISKGQARKMSNPRALAASLKSANMRVAADATCTPLAPGHKRRIFFNVPADNPNGFGLGYEEIDANGTPVPGTFSDVKPFDPTRPTICVPMGAGNQPAVERWELVNLAGEDHNFHIHQVHFAVLSAAEVASTALPSSISGHSVLMDNLPLVHADGTCVTVDDWRNGACTAHVATVEIPFSVAGDFVYHCHILEHEDGGMMAVIRVRPDAASQQLTMLDKVMVNLGLREAAPAVHFPFNPAAEICTTKPSRNTRRKASRKTVDLVQVQAKQTAIR